jgi:hypothetical protein
MKVAASPLAPTGAWSVPGSANAVSLVATPVLISRNDEPRLGTMLP